MFGQPVVLECRKCVWGEGGKRAEKTREGRERETEGLWH